jgi:hypothetical protein
MTRRVAILFLIFASFSCYAQMDTTKTNLKFSCNLKIAYNSSLIYPGLRTGIECPIRLVKKIKIKKSGFQKIVFKDWFISGNIGWYHHPAYHDNIYFTVEGIMRKTLANGFFSEFSPGVGYSRTFLGGTTYTVDDNGNVSIKRFAGYNYVLAIISGGFGYDFSKMKSKPFSLFSKFSILTMFQYNNTVYLRPTIEFGVIYKPEKLFMVKPKIKSIVK